MSVGCVLARDQHGSGRDVGVEHDDVGIEILSEDAAQLALVRRASDHVETLGLQEVVQGARRIELGEDDAHGGVRGRDEASLHVVLVRIGHNGTPGSPGACIHPLTMPNEGQRFHGGLCIAPAPYLDVGGSGDIERCERLLARGRRRSFHIVELGSNMWNPRRSSSARRQRIPARAVTTAAGSRAPKRTVRTRSPGSGSRPTDRPSASATPTGSSCRAPRPCGSSARCTRDASRRRRRTG